MSVAFSIRSVCSRLKGIKGKIDELMISLRNQAPSLICLTEHHLMDHEIDAIHIKKYNLGAKFCRRKLKNVGYV